MGILVLFFLGMGMHFVSNKLINNVKADIPEGRTPTPLSGHWSPSVCPTLWQGMHKPACYITDPQGPCDVRRRCPTAP
ncbi:hypothetical protein [Thermoflexibacter ruber]|uniref:hypothetical protein n=1 Tax=Thermoflexibacter ruber TaxID=1003 RepID=UPI0011604380|nr:hypothetical protein [Thermoflexibacter ruber]